MDTALRIQDRPRAKQAGVAVLYQAPPNPSIEGMPKGCTFCVPPHVICVPPHVKC
jgi:hypothetical protein